VKIGEKNGLCPYYAQRYRQDTAHLHLMPYNYILNSKIRSATGIDLNNKIVVIDEAHNIAKACESSLSISVTQDEI
jgi:chromosome transmission fidelity protein 1